MAIPVQAARASIVGLLPSGEQFDTSFWIAANSFASQADVDGAAASIAALWTPASVPNFYAALGLDSSFDRLRLYAYPTGGPNATWMGEASFATKPGTGTLNDMPLQSSVVLSLRTATIGRRARGRMYFPMVNTTLVTNQLDAGVPGVLTSQLAAFFSGVNALPAPVGQVCVLSQVLGTTQSVTHVIADTRLDIQRRRAMSQAVIATAEAAVS